MADVKEIKQERDLYTSLFVTTASFRFVVHVDGMPAGAFTECTLPSIEWEMEEIKEGGFNTSVHRVPGRRKAATVTLKNGIGTVKELLEWCIDAMNESYKRRNVTITMHNSELKTIVTWHLEGALPTRWSGPELKTDNSAVAMQTLELTCGTVSVEKGEGWG
jgi:phage tail-like protein